MERIGFEGRGLTLTGKGTSMRFPATFTRLNGLAILLGVLLSACVVAEGPIPGSGQFPPERPEFCTQEYAPVCARRGGDRQTFANACRAEVAGFRVVSGGECQLAGGPVGPGFCTREYAPVCGRRGGNMRTFGNSCEAENEGYRIISFGQCRLAGPESGFDRPGFCTREYAPVCGRRGRDLRTFANSCEAESTGYGVVADGPCRMAGGAGGFDEPRFCSREYRPVCARRGGSIRTFPNECVAGGAGYRVIAGGPC